MLDTATDKDAHTEASIDPLTLLGGDLVSRFSEYEVLRATTRPLVEDAIVEVARIACLVGVSVTEFTEIARDVYHAVQDGDPNDGSEVEGVV